MVPPALSLDHDSRITLYIGRTRFTTGSTATLMLSDSLGGPIPVIPDGIRAGSSRSLIPVAPDRRGIALVGPVIVHGVDPLQLLRVDQAYGSPVAVVVPPRILPITFDSSTDGQGGSGRAAPGSQVFASQLRDYVSGDEVRRIHWRGTAKRGRLMVHQGESAASQGLRIILDSRSDHLGPPRQACASERAIAIAASLAVMQCEAGQDIRIAVGSAPMEANAGSRSKVLRYFATLPESDPARLRGQIQQLVAGSRAGVLIAIVTDVSMDLTSLLVEESRIERRIALLIRDLGAPRVESAMLTRLAAAGWRTAIVDGSIDETQQHLLAHSAAHPAGARRV